MSNDPPKKLFRKEAWEKFTSPEMLDQRLTVVSSKGWIALSCMILLMIGTIFWAIFGQIPSTLNSKAIYLNSKGLEVIRSPEEGTLIKITAQVGETLSPGSPLAILQPLQNMQNIPIKVQEEGKVIEIPVSSGEVVKKGATLFTLEKKEGDSFFYAYLPIETSQLIKPGMEVYLQIAGISSERYGKLKGQVASLSPFVVSEEHLLERLGDPSLVNYFTHSEPVVEVVIAPEKDSATMSGLKWTSQKGPPQKVERRSIATITVILQSRRPISYVFPLFSGLPILDLFHNYY